MKLSIVIAVYNSHKVVVRQLRHFKKMDLPDTVEIILVDDGSNPPLDYKNCGLKNLKILFTNDKRPWTQGLARNMGAKEAQGEFILFTDIDHIITKEAIEAVLEFKGDKMIFPRFFGIFNRIGDVLTDSSLLLQFGLSTTYARRGFSGGVHGNTFAIRKNLFEKIGGFDARYCDKRFHVGGKYMSEERHFNNKWDRLQKAKKVKPQVRGPKIYVYPTSKFRIDRDNNPFGLFHSLSLEQKPQPNKP